MDKIFVNIILLLMLGYFQLSKVNIRCFKLFHTTLFTTIYGSIIYGYF
jgi:hypothetical protein